MYNMRIHMFSMWIYMNTTGRDPCAVLEEMDWKYVAKIAKNHKAWMEDDVYEGSM